MINTTYKQYRWTGLSWWLLLVAGIILTAMTLGSQSAVAVTPNNAGTWTQKADMPTVRMLPGSAVVDGIIYVIGGAPFDYGASTVVEAYDPATDTWTARADMSTARQGPGAAVVDGIIYVIGGNEGLAAGDRDLSTVEAYDPATDTWTTKANMPTPRSPLSVAAVDGIIYAIGGVSGTDDETGELYETGEVIVLPTVEAYDPATDTWTTKADIPTARWSPALWVANGQIYVSGGAELWDFPFGMSATVEVYDPPTDTWTQASDMPRTRFAHSASVVAGKVYLIGGADDGLAPGPTVTVYDLATETWTIMADQPIMSGQHAGSVVDDKIYIIGGAHGPDMPKLSDVYEYAPDLRDFSNVFFVQLGAGLNMISLPLEPIISYTARSFAEEIGATAVIRYDEAARRFSGFTLDAPDDGFGLEGGKGYIVNTPAGGVFAANGAAWTNEPADLAAPPTQSQGAWAFVVSGSVLDGEAMSVRDGNYTLVARNLRTRALTAQVVDSSGYFAAAWADLSRRSVVEAGDRIEVSVMDSNGAVVSGPSVHEVTLDGIRDAVVKVQLHLGSVIPEKSVLLQNYPNPFNPETWIPYQLKDQASVSIRLYDTMGGLIRTMDLGHRNAGVYTSRSAAAYWDGRNDAGEQVSSGVYFYTIQAGEFAATRKMIITK